MKIWPSTPCMVNSGTKAATVMAAEKNTAVSTSSALIRMRRSRSVQALPDIPAVGELVPGYEASQWFGVVAPKSTPRDIIDRLNREINEGLADPELKARLEALGETVVARSPADFEKRIAADADKWANVIRTARISIQ